MASMKRVCSKEGEILLYGGGTYSDSSNKKTWTTFSSVYSDGSACSQWKGSHQPVSHHRWGLFSIYFEYKMWTFAIAAPAVGTAPLRSDLGIRWMYLPFARSLLSKRIFILNLSCSVCFAYGLRSAHMKHSLVPVVRLPHAMRYYYVHLAGKCFCISE